MQFLICRCTLRTDQCWPCCSGSCNVIYRRTVNTDQCLASFLAAGQVQPPSQQATRHARRIYVGGLPPTANEQNIATFFSNALAAVGGTTAGPGKPSLHIASSPVCIALTLTMRRTLLLPSSNAVAAVGRSWRVSSPSVRGLRPVSVCSDQ